MIRPRGLWEKNCSCFDSVLVILTSRDLVHTFELGSREFQSYDCEFKSDRNVLSNLLEFLWLTEIREVCLSILRFAIQIKRETTLLGDSRSWLDWKILRITIDVSQSDHATKGILLLLDNIYVKLIKGFKVHKRKIF